MFKMDTFNDPLPIQAHESVATHDFFHSGSFN